MLLTTGFLCRSLKENFRRLDVIEQGWGGGWGWEADASTVCDTEQLCAACLVPAVVRSRKGRGHLLGEAVCSGEDPCWCDETAPTEVGPIALDADLPGPLAF